MTATYINPALPSMIRGLYKADLREKSIQNVLDLAADLIQELIDVRAQTDREPSDAEVEAAADAIVEASFGQDLPEAPIDLARAALLAAQAVRRADAS